QQDPRQKPIPRSFPPLSYFAHQGCARAVVVFGLRVVAFGLCPGHRPRREPPYRIEYARAMGAVREFAERLWAGADDNAMMSFLGLEEHGPGLAFVSSFANVPALDTAEGLVLVDTSSQLTAGVVEQAVRAWSKKPVSVVIYTHGHVDHVMGTALFEGARR